MKVAVGVLTHNAIRNDRKDLLTQTVASLDGGDVLVADNGSSDGTDELVAQYRHVVFPRLPGFPHGNTCGYGMNKLAATLHQTDADIIVLSNDDIAWKPGAMDRLAGLWASAPAELVLLSGLVEATYALPGQEPWNKPIAAATVLDQRILYRKSVPGGAWSYRNSDYERIFPVSTFPGVDDVPACHRLVAQGLLCACTDLAEHAGLERSTWGNGSDRFIVESRDAVFAEYEL